MNTKKNYFWSKRIEHRPNNYKTRALLFSPEDQKLFFIGIWRRSMKGGYLTSYIDVIGQFRILLKKTTRTIWNKINRNISWWNPTSVLSKHISNETAFLLSFLKHTNFIIRNIIYKIYLIRLPIFTKTFHKNFLIACSQYLFNK